MREFAVNTGFLPFPANPRSVSNPAPGSGTTLIPSELVNLFAFQRMKSWPSTKLSALKFPSDHKRLPVNLAPFQAMSDLFLAALQILDLDGDAITNDVITPPMLNLFSDPLFTIDFAPAGNEQNRIWVTLTNLQQVPEPTSLAMLLSSAQGIGLVRRLGRVRAA